MLPVNQPPLPVNEPHTEFEDDGKAIDKKWGQQNLKKPLLIKPSSNPHELIDEPADSHASPPDPSGDSQVSGGSPQDL